MVIKPPNISERGVTALFTTRDSDDPVDHVSRQMRVTVERIYLPVQKHTNTIHVLKSSMERVIADAVVTDRKGVLIGVEVADCVPVLLFDGRRIVAAAVHAGWRGTATGILRETIGTMAQRFSSSPEDIFVAIGPSIRGCCYEVGDDVASAVDEGTGEGPYQTRREGRCFLDLSSANMIQAVSSGIPEGNIWKSPECTCCNPERFYSYRQAKGTIGRQGGFIGMW